MLWNRCNLLRFILCAIFILASRPTVVLGQLDDGLAPWRLENFDPGDLELPTTVDLNPASGDSLSYKLRITCRLRQENHGTAPALTNPFRIGPKVAVQGPHEVFLGVSLEKEPGESLFWDHSALTASLPLPDNHGRLVLGDYLIGYGQGLVISTARNFGLGRNAIGNLKPRLSGVKPYNGWAEELALRGAAVEVSTLGLDLAAWGSSRQLHVSLDSSGAIRSFHASAHTQSREEAWGGRLECRQIVKGWGIGSTIYSTQYDRALRLGNNLLNRSGAAGVDVNWSDSTVSASLETAWDMQGHNAQTGQVRWRAEAWSLEQALYRLEADYYSPLASTLDLGQNEVNNREGSYSALEYRYRHIEFMGFMHLYRFPRRIFSTSWGGQDISLSAEGRIAPHVQLAVASRWTKEIETDSLDRNSRWRGSGLITINPASDWELRAGIQLCRAAELVSVGQLLQLGITHELKIGPAAGMEIAVNGGMYQADEYSQRLFWFETDRSGSFQVHSLWGGGEVVQLTMAGFRQNWGQAALSLWWDTPNAGFKREVARNLSLVYRYP
jgi:hypothetical protein